VSAVDSSDLAKQANGQRAAEGACPGCAKPLPNDASRCPNCGLALGEHQRCPHCHAICDVEPSAEARFVCSICGGVRIPIDDAKVVRSPEGIELLKRATAARSARTIWRVVGSCVAAFAVLSVLVLWLAITFAHPPQVATVAAALAVMAPFAFSIYAWRRSRVCGANIRPALDKAWALAAADVARSRGGELDAKELAKQTRITERDADQLLARMSADSLLVSSATADGNLKYTLVESGGAESDKSLPLTR
jgi:hypothetical protein